MKQNDDQDQAESRLQDLIHAPGAVPEHGETDHHRNRGGDDLGQHRHGKSGAGPTHAQFGLDSLLEDGDVVLELAGKESPDFRVHAVGVGNQCQQSEQ